MEKGQTHVVRLISSYLFFYRSRKARLQPYGIRRTDHAAPLYPQKLALTSPTSGCRSVGIVPSLTKATELVVEKVKTFM
jgi:hypothetical protein